LAFDLTLTNRPKLTFFNNITSEYIQFVSMFLEIIGITLAYIEIRYKPLATKIEGRILMEETRIKDFAYNLLKHKFFSALITVFITVVFFIEIPYLAGFFDRIVPKEWNDIKIAVIWLTLPIIVLFALGICFILLSDFISWLNRFSHGHAIGALGVVVTFLGLLGETYQVVTILVGE
jgi:protein-S-isoprenylcysteine O-methyltransferase Ste14